VARVAVENSDDIADGACILGRLTLLLAYAARMRRIAEYRVQPGAATASSRR
jgi:hypothetical protein